MKDSVSGVLAWRPNWPWQEKPRAAEAPLTGAAAAPPAKTGNVEVVRPLRDPAGLAPLLEEALRRRGFDVGVISGTAALKTQRSAGSWESETESSMSAWSFHFVPTYSGPDARQTAGVVGRDFRPARRVRVHFEYDLDPSERRPTLVRFNSTLIDADAGTVVGHMAFSGNRGVDSVLSDVASMVPRALR